MGFDSLFLDFQDEDVLPRDTSTHAAQPWVKAIRVTGMSNRLDDHGLTRSDGRRPKDRKAPLVARRLSGQRVVTDGL